MDDLVGIFTMVPTSFVIILTTFLSTRQTVMEDYCIELKFEVTIVSKNIKD